MINVGGSTCGMLSRRLGQIKYGGVFAFPTKKINRKRPQIVSGNMAVSRMRSKKYAIKSLFMAQSPKFPRLVWNRDRGTPWWCQILDREWKYGRFAHAQWILIRNITRIYGAVAEITAFYWKSGSSNTMVMSDFRPGVEIWPFRACAVKTQYNTC